MAIVLAQAIIDNVSPGDEVLDIGCGNKEKLTLIPHNKVTTVDAWEKVRPDVLVDLNTADLPFPPMSFDVALMIDFIEHLEKARGAAILEQAKSIVRKKIILLTPLWWTDNAANVNNAELWCYQNPFDYHRSLWKIEDFGKGWERMPDIEGFGSSYYLAVWRKPC